MHFSSTATLSAGAVQQILRLAHRPVGLDPLRFADTAQAPVMEILCRRISAATLSTRDLLLTTGFGLATDPRIPVRMPSLLIPGLHVLESCHKAGLPVPRYLVYQATDFIARTNGHDLAQAREQSARIAAYLGAYVRAFHAQIADSVLFCFGEKAECPEEDICAVSTDLEQVAADDAIAGEIVCSLRASERRHSLRTGQFLRYAAANVLCSGAYKGRFPFASAPGTEPSAIFPIGGKAEIPFFRLTARQGQRHAGGTEIIPFITTIGERPTYYPYPQLGDPCSLAELTVSTHMKDGPIRRDLDAMRHDGATHETLQTIYPSQK